MCCIAWPNFCCNCMCLFLFHSLGHAAKAYVDWAAIACSTWMCMVRCRHAAACGALGSNSQGLQKQCSWVPTGTLVCDCCVAYGIYASCIVCTSSACACEVLALKADSCPVLTPVSPVVLLTPLPACKSAIQSQSLLLLVTDSVCQTLRPCKSLAQALLHTRFCKAATGGHKAGGRRFIPLSIT